MKKVRNLQPNSFEKYEISVIDDGSGIEEEDISNLFEPIALNSNLANKNREAKVKSNGIGLSISKRIAQSLGGDLILVPTE